MTQAQHTPGPWTTAKRESGIAIEHREVRPYGWAQSEVALVYPLAMPDRKTGEANARLIAASPDLLEALDTLMGLIEMTGPRCIADYKLPIIAARAAITKAKGV